MKIIRFCIILFLAPIFAFSSGVKEAKDSILTIHRIDSLKNLAKYYFKKEDFLKSFECNLKIIDSYYQKGDFENLANSYNQIVLFFISIKNFDLAEKYQHIMTNAARNTLNPVFRGWFFANSAQIRVSRGELDNAIRDLYLAFVYFQKAKSPWMEGRVYKFLGDVYAQKKCYDKAFFAYMKANSYYSMTHDDFEIAVIYTSIAHLYHLQDKNLNNLKYNLLAMHIREKICDAYMISFSCLNVGEAFWLIGRKDSAQVYFHKSLELAKKDKSSYLLQSIFHQLYDFAKEEKKFKDALQYYTKSIEYKKRWKQEQAQSEIAILAASYSIREAETSNELQMQDNQIQDLQFKKQRIQIVVFEIVFLALMSLILLINIVATKNRNRKNEIRALNEQLKAEICERIEAEGKLHQSEELYRFLAENTADVISLLDGKMKLLYVSPSCEKLTGFTPTEILQMNTPLDLIEPSHKDTAKYRILELLRIKQPTKYRYRALRKDGSSFWAESHWNPVLDPKSGAIKEIISVVRDISEQMNREEELDKNTRQKEYLLREIHNRVKNNFAILNSLMNMQRDQTFDSELNSSITELQLRVRTMSLVHEQLYHTHDISVIPFDEYLRNLTLIISTSFKNNRIRLETDIQPCAMPIEMALPMGLIVNELLTNAYKYAFPGDHSGTIWVKLLPEADGNYSIYISDNGIGLSNNFAMTNTQSVGSQIVHILIAQIEARLEFFDEEGACFRILFSPQPEK